jgi:Domain of unknown function (DUF1707)
VTAGRADETAGDAGRMLASQADRDQVIDVLKVAFVEGRLAKDEFDLRVSKALASRTYADLHALSSDIPGGLARVRPPAEPARQPGRGLAPRRMVRVTAVGAGASMAFVVLQLAAASHPVPTAVGVILVSLTGFFMAGLLAALLTFLSWAVQRPGREPSQGPPSGPDGRIAQAPAPGGHLPAAGQLPPNEQIPPVGCGRRDQRRGAFWPYPAVYPA